MLTKSVFPDISDCEQFSSSELTGLGIRSKVVTGHYNVTANHNYYLTHRIYECTVSNSEPDPYPVRSVGAQARASDVLRHPRSEPCNQTPD